MGQQEPQRVYKPPPIWAICQVWSRSSEDCLWDSIGLPNENWHLQDNEKVLKHFRQSADAKPHFPGKSEPLSSVGSILWDATVVLEKMPVIQSRTRNLFTHSSRILEYQRGQVAL